MPVESGLSTVIQGQDDAGKLAEMIMRMKESHHQRASEDLRTMTDLIQKGVPVDPKQAEKALKDWQKSGQSLAQRAVGGVKGLVGKGEGQATSDQGKAIQAVGKAGVQASGAQAGTPVGEQTAKEHPAGGVEPQLDMKGWIQSIQHRQALVNQSEAAKLKTDTMVNELKQKAVEGDEGARTQLQKIGEMAYDKNFEMVAGMSPEKKAEFYQNQIGIAEGMETQKDRLAREERLHSSYISAGYSPQDASRLVQDPRSAVPKTITQLAGEAKHYADLQESFGDEAAKQIAPALASGASLGDVLPNVGKTQSHFAESIAETRKYHEEEMKVREREASAAEKRASNELGQEKLDLLTRKFELELDKASNQALRESFLDIIQSEKAGIKIPKEVKDKYIEDLAKRVGLSKREVGGWWSWLVGSSTVYGPDVEKGKKVLDELAPGTEGIAPSPMSSRQMGVEDEASKVRTEEQKRKAGMMTEDPLAGFLKMLGTSSPRPGVK